MVKDFLESKIYIKQHACSSRDIHPTEVKRAAIRIEHPGDDIRYNRDRNKRIDMKDGTGRSMFLAYEFREEDSDEYIVVKNARWCK